MTDTEQAIAEAKVAIVSAVTAATERLRARTGLLVTVDIETINIDTYDRPGRLYTATLRFSA